MPAAAVIAAGGGLAIGGAVGSYFSSRESAKAQEKASLAQMEEARRTREQAMGFATPTEMELQDLERLYQANQNYIAQSNIALEKQKALLDAVDPALIEAGKQAYQLLQGKEAQALAPIRRQRLKQRIELENQLKERLGSGYETSTAGIQALSAFDESTDNVLSQAQERTTNSFLGLSAQVRPDYLGDVGRQASTSAGLVGARLSAQGNIKSRQISALTGTPLLPQNAFTGDVLRAQAESQLYSGLSNIGGSMLGAGLGGGMKQPQASQSTGQMGNLSDASSFSSQQQMQNQQPYFGGGLSPTSGRGVA